MNNEIVKGKIIAQLEVIISQVQHIEQYAQQIPQIEIDLALDNIRRLYDQFQELDQSNKLLKMEIENVQEEKNISATQSLYKSNNDGMDHISEQMISDAAKPLIISEKNVEDFDIQSIVELDTDFPPLVFETTSREDSKQASSIAKLAEKPYRDPATIDMFDFDELNAQEPPKIEAVDASEIEEKDEMPEAVEEITVDEVEKEPETEKEPEIEAETELDVVENSEIEVNPELETKPEEVNLEEPISNPSLEQLPSKSLAEHLIEMRESLRGGIHFPKHPIPNLKSAIGINEKFLFINELFKGDMKAYNDFITEIDDAGLKDHAFLSVNRNKETYNWFENSHAYTTLINFIERRFL